MPTATINNLAINYEIRGSGRALVLAHGYCASIRMWDRLIPMLEKHYQVIAYDARGHGLSSAPAGAENYGLRTLVDDLHALLDFLAIESACLVGHSMGGATVQAFNHLHRDRTWATLICNIDGGYQVISESERTQAERVRDDNHRFVEQFGMVDYARRQIEREVAPTFVRDDELELQAYLARYAGQAVNGFLGVGHAQPWREDWLKQTASELSGPIAVIAGTQDAMYDGARALHQTITNSRFATIRDAPHDSVNARPGAFNQAVSEFLLAVRSGAPWAGKFAY